MAVTAQDKSLKSHVTEVHAKGVTYKVVVPDCESDYIQGILADKH